MNILTVSGDRLLYTFSGKPSELVNITIDTLTVNTTYNMELVLLDRDERLAVVKKTFTTVSFVLPIIFTNSSSWSHSSDGILITFPVWSKEDNPGTLLTTIITDYICDPGDPKYRVVGLGTLELSFPFFIEQTTPVIHILIFYGQLSRYSSLKY